MPDYQQKKGKEMHTTIRIAALKLHVHTLSALRTGVFFFCFLFDNHIQIHLELLAPFIEISKDGCIK